MMKSVRFGDGAEVCPIGQGTWQMGSRRREEVQALRHGVELGMTLIDTAEMYGNEELVGEAVRDCRDKAFIVSKVHPRNAGYEGTKRACEGSLRRLGTDRIDLYLLHWKGPYPLEETVRALAELRREGKIVRWGMSNLDTADMERVAALPHGGECASDQVLYNMAERGVEYDLLPWCAEHGMPVMAYTPLEEGKLAGSKVLAAIAARHGATPVQVALAWTIRHEGVIAIPKAGSTVHVEENFRSLSLELTEADLADIDAAFPPPAGKVPLVGW